VRGELSTQHRDDKTQMAIDRVARLWRWVWITLAVILILVVVLAVLAVRQEHGSIGSLKLNIIGTVEMTASAKRTGNRLKRRDIKVNLGFAFS
jgi:anti-sigma-K factor RskA